MKILSNIYRWSATPLLRSLGRKMKKLVYNNISFYNIKDYDNYYISKCGKVLKLYKNQKIRLLKERICPKGYNILYLYKNSKGKNQRVHRLVAQTFIQNTDKKPHINHIDGNPLNNNVSNLEWCTHSENIRHSFKSLNRVSGRKGKTGKLNYNSRKIGQYKDGKLLNIFYGLGEIDRKFKKNKINGACVYYTLNKKNNNFYQGYEWFYLNDYK